MLSLQYSAVQGLPNSASQAPNYCNNIYIKYHEHMIMRYMRWLTNVRCGSPCCSSPIPLSTSCSDLECSSVNALLILYTFLLHSSAAFPLTASDCLQILKSAQGSEVCHSVAVNLCKAPPPLSACSWQVKHLYWTMISQSDFDIQWINQ